MAYLEYLGMALMSPREYMRLIIVERRSLITGFSIVLVMSVLWGLIASTIFMARTLSFIGLHLIGLWAMIGSVGVIVLASIILWLMFSGFIYVYSKIFNGKAVFEHVLNATSLLWLTVFLHGLFSPLYYSVDYITGILLFIAIESICFVWGLVLVVISVSEANKYGIGRSFASVLLALLTMTLLVILPPLTIIPWWLK